VNRRPLLLLGAVLAIAAVADFTQRVHVGRDASLRAFEAPPAQPLPAPEPAAAVNARLARWLPETAAAADAAGAPASTELRLAGVMAGRGGTTAILATVPPAGQPARSFAVAEGDVVEGFRVTRIEPRVVTLEGDTGTRRLVLFERKQADSKSQRDLRRQRELRELRQKNEQRSKREQSDPQAPAAPQARAE
jgi:hypothetical protein